MGRPKGKRDTVPRRGPDGLTKAERDVERGKKLLGVPLATEVRSGVTRKALYNGTSTHSDYDTEENAFLIAMDRYKTERRRPFPTWREVLAVLHSLGYRRVAELEPMPQFVHPNKLTAAERNGEAHGER